MCIRDRQITIITKSKRESTASLHTKLPHEINKPGYRTRDGKPWRECKRRQSWFHVLFLSNWNTCTNRCLLCVCSLPQQSFSQQVVRRCDVVVGFHLQRSATTVSNCQNFSALCPTFIHTHFRSHNFWPTTLLVIANNKRTTCLVVTGILPYFCYTMVFTCYFAVPASESQRFPFHPKFGVWRKNDTRHQSGFILCSLQCFCTNGWLVASASGS